MEQFLSPEKSMVSKPTFYRRLFGFRNLLIFLAVSFAVLTYFAKSYPYFEVDLMITKNIQQLRPLWFDTLMILITRSGDIVPVVVSTASAFLLALLLRHWRDGLGLLVSTYVGILISQAFKEFVSRPRPDADLIIQLDSFIRSDSFPSGHVMFYVSFYGFLFFIVYSHFKKSWLRNLLLTLFSLPIVLGGLSRIYVGAHWFSDVLGAYLVGSIWLLTVVSVYNRFAKTTSKKPTEI